jgi:hypothetical protein
LRICVDYVRNTLPRTSAPALPSRSPPYLLQYYTHGSVRPSSYTTALSDTILYCVVPSFRQCPVVYISVPCRCVCVRPPRSVRRHDPGPRITIIEYTWAERTNGPHNSKLRYVWLFVCSSRSATSVLICYVRSHGHGWRGVCVLNRLLLFVVCHAVVRTVILLVVALVKGGTDTDGQQLPLP